MRMLDLFSGIGGFSLAGRWMGWETIQFVEIDKFCQKILNKHWPNVPIHGDIKTFDATSLRGTVDIVTGGDPCQPHSVAGLGAGTEDVRFLWPEMFRITCELDVPWVVNENVSGSIANGVLDLKIDNLESRGYTCQSYSIPAESVGALHQRERIWLVAHNPNSNKHHNDTGKISKEKSQQKMETQRDEIYQLREPVDLWPSTSDSDIERWKEHYDTTLSEAFTQGLSRYFGFGANPHGHIPRQIIESGIMGMLHGLPEGMDYADRSKRIKANGNAIVPQVVYEIFKAIELCQSLTTPTTRKTTTGFLR